MSHLSSVAMLVSFNASQWTARKIDKAKSAELTERNKAKDKSAHVSKKLVQADTLQEIATLITQARDFHKANTSPWLDNGTRILSAKRFPTYTTGMEGMEAEFYPLVRRFVENFPRYVQQAAQEEYALGKLWDANDYPSVSKIERAFGWSNKFFELPNADDFRVDVGQAAVDRIKAQIQANVDSAATNAVRDVFERAYEVVGKMVESLNGFDPSKSGKDRGIFRDSLVTNIRDLAELMPDLNFTNDARISKLADDMKALAQHDAEDLRASDNIRISTVQAAQDILDSMADFTA